MPIGNGDIGANVWAEADGDLFVLLAKCDAWDETGSLLKLGRIRVTINPNPFAKGEWFQQTLRLGIGGLEIVAGTWTRISMWVDANRPIVHVVVNATKPIDVEVSLENWRQAPTTVKTQTGDIFKNLTGPDPAPTVVRPDQIVDGQKDRIVWFHHNKWQEHDGFEMNMRLQGLGEMLPRISHPLRGRIFGASVVGDHFTSVNSTTIRSTEQRLDQYFGIHALTTTDLTIEEWKTQIANNVFDGRNTPRARKEHETWWNEFWERSYVFIESPEAFHVTQSYLLQRFMNACASRGGFPIKHNGSLFSVGRDGNPDFRRWGAGFWFMNQRLVYWPMLASGDFDLMLPWLRMYRNSLELQQHRTRTYFKHGGAHYPETIFFWGAEVSAHYGWIPFEQRARPEAECPYLTYYWSGGIELTLILLEYFRYTGDEKFAREFLLPIGDAAIEFFDLHYSRDAQGKIHFEPAQSLETWHEAVNPLPEIAGLQYTLSRLLELPAGLTTEDQRNRWTRLLSELPPLPIGERDGKRIVLPAERFDKKKNTENPELYCIFPYRLFGVGRPDIDLARNTFAARLHKSHECWSQDEIQMALLGLAQEARESLIKRAAPESHSDSRFPGFWNAFHDWIPDVDHGGVLQMALQLMLAQQTGGELLLLPAWPKEWDADFKLHAPDQTIVQGSVRNGEMVDVKFTRPGVNSPNT
jgi:hypothetical protein